MSYNNIYNIKDIEKDILRSLNQLKGSLKAWESVTYNTKKDGKPFKVLSKNFNGLYWGNDVWGHLNSVYVFGGTYSNRDDIYFSFYGIDLENATVDQIKNAINERKKQLEDDIEDYETQLLNVEKYFNKIDEELKHLKELFNDPALMNPRYDFPSCNSLAYRLKDYIKGNL